MSTICYKKEVLVNYIFLVGSGVTSLAHCDGCGMEAGIQNMVKLVMELSHGAPEGRLV